MALSTIKKEKLQKAMKINSPEELDKIIVLIFKFINKNEELKALKQIKCKSPHFLFYIKRNLSEENANITCTHCKKLAQELGETLEEYSKNYFPLKNPSYHIESMYKPEGGLICSFLGDRKGSVSYLENLSLKETKYIKHLEKRKSKADLLAISVLSEFIIFLSKCYSILNYADGYHEQSIMIDSLENTKLQLAGYLGIRNSDIDNISKKNPQNLSENNSTSKLFEAMKRINEAKIILEKEQKLFNNNLEGQLKTKTVQTLVSDAALRFIITIKKLIDNENINKLKPNLYYELFHSLYLQEIGLQKTSKEAGEDYQLISPEKIKNHLF